MKKLFVISLLMCICSGAMAFEENVFDKRDQSIELVQTGRYTHVKNIPPVDQKNPLKVVVLTKVPQSAQTVGEAINYLLSRSGYVLADISVMSSETRNLMQLPLPQVQRNIGPITLDKALKTLGGESFELVVDPVHRIVNFELSSKFGG